MALYIRQLKKQYVSPDGGAVPVIDVPAFDLAGGEQVALVGGSGTGKTTLLHLIAGILTPDSGQILFTEKVEGSATARRSSAAAQVGSLAAVGAGGGRGPGRTAAHPTTAPPKRSSITTRRPRRGSTSPG